MKQVLTTIYSFVRSFSSTSPQGVLSKCRLVLMLAVIALLVSSCQKENLLSSSQTQDLLSSSKKQDIAKKAVPFKAKFQTRLTPTQIIGTGEGSHIGHSTLVVNDDDTNFPLLTGTQIITSANGDLLFSSHSGLAIGPDGNGIILITLNNIITGGIGRFVGATGSFTAHAITDLNTSSGTVTFDGTISY